MRWVGSCHEPLPPNLADTKRQIEPVNGQRAQLPLPVDWPVMTEAVAQAERELDGKGWLPSPLLTPGAVQADAADRQHNDIDDEAPMSMAG